MTFSGIRRSLATSSGKPIDIYDEVFTHDEVIYSHESLLKSVFRVDGIDEASSGRCPRQVYSKFSEDDLKGFGIMRHPKMAEISKEHNLHLRPIKPVDYVNLEEPLKYIEFEKIVIYKNPINVKTKLDELSFIPLNKKKWGMVFMNGCRKISKEDYIILTE